MHQLEIIHQVNTYISKLFQEIFQGQKYKMSVEEEGFVHKLVISNPTLADMGKYTCEVNGVITEAYLEVEGNDMIPFFCKKWKKSETYI